MPSADKFLTAVYDSLHDTPMQRKFRRLAPMPVGAVFIEQPGMTEADIRGHFRLMKTLGFTCLKQLMVIRKTDRRKIMHWAMDEGIIPFWYDDGGFEDITPALLKKLGIAAGADIQSIRANKKFISFQQSLLRKRIDRLHVPAAGMADKVDAKFPFTFDTDLPNEAIPYFAAWLRKTYGTFAAVQEAWNFHHMGGGASRRVNARLPWRTWKDAACCAQRMRPLEYRHLRDVLRFKADVFIERVRDRSGAALKFDKDAPFRAGGEMGLFLPFAARGTDMEGIASALADGGSFYPSIHLAWHFEEVNFEVPRCVYMQASMVADWFKGGWSGPWESTGGPQQLSGGKAHLYPPAAGEIPGFTVDERVITQLMLSYLAGGFRGFGFWCWNGRTFGWEAGEFALLDRNNQPTLRAVAAGKIGQAAQRWRDELWQAHKEPHVGVLIDWDSDAIWAAAAVSGRDHFKHFPMQARVGLCRALINHNVPFEHVTPTDLRKGLGSRYKVIYMPAMLALSESTLKLLEEYVRDGGRLVADMPTGWYDDFGRLLSTAPGTAFERIFGATIRDFQYSRNIPWSIGGEVVGGFTADLGVTGAKVVEKFDDGKPAVTLNRYGRGVGVVLAIEASHACLRPGNVSGEKRLLQHALGKEYAPPFICDGAISYRLTSPAADHYFLINDGPDTKVKLKFLARKYRGMMDAVTGEKLSPSRPASVAAFSGRWLRLAK